MDRIGLFEKYGVVVKFSMGLYLKKKIVFKIIVLKKMKDVWNWKYLLERNKYGKYIF